MQVSELIVHYLERLKIGEIFGIPGAHILPLYDHLYDSTIRSILVKHEQGAAFMAGGTARTKGRVSACITTAGPGATNLVTGIANAYVDRLPVIIITGETPTHVFGKGGLQESSGEGGSVDQSQLFAGITRYHKLIERTDYLPTVLARANRILLGRKPGPVALSIPYNIQLEEVSPEILEQIPFEPPALPLPPGQETIDQLCNELRQARKAVIIAGYGCIQAGATAQLQQLDRHPNITITTTLKGKGAVDETSRQGLGTLGVTSNGSDLKTITTEADLLLILGAGFNERTSYLWKPELFANKRVIQVDHDASRLERGFRADIAIECDLLQLLDAVVSQLPPPPVSTADALPRSTTESEMMRSIPTIIRQLFATLHQRITGPLALFDDNIIYGQNLFRATHAHRYYPNSGFSSLGHALPAAIGSSLVTGQPTFALLGDGGFQMCCMELMTAVNHDIAVNVLVLTNDSMGLIRKNQFQQYHQRFIASDFDNPNYSLLAQSFGISYIKISTQEDLERMFQTLDLHQGINLIEIPIDKNAFPAYHSGR